MKKNLITLASIAVLSLSSSYAESFPAYGENSYQVTHGDQKDMQPGNFYASIGYSYTNANVDIPALYFGSALYFDIQADNINLAIGYDFNQYFAIEARYTTSVTDLDFSVENGYGDKGLSWGGDLSNLGLYLKPKYQVEQIALYALLGYGHIRLDIDNIGDSSENEFQWGLGLSMDVGSSIVAGTETSLFLDYVRFYDDSQSQIDMKIDAITAGITFKF